MLWYILFLRFIYIYIYIHISCCINSKFIHIKLKDAWFIAKEYQRGVHILSNEWRRDWFVIILNDINYPSCASYFEWRYSLYVMRLKLKRNVLILNKCHDIPRAGFNSNICGISFPYGGTLYSISYEVCLRTNKCLFPWYQGIEINNSFHVNFQFLRHTRHCKGNHDITSLLFQ